MLILWHSSKNIFASILWLPYKRETENQLQKFHIWILFSLLCYCFYRDSFECSLSHALQHIRWQSSKKISASLLFCGFPTNRTEKKNKINRVINSACVLCFEPLTIGACRFTLIQPHFSFHYFFHSSLSTHKKATILWLLYLWLRGIVMTEQSQWLTGGGGGGSIQVDLQLRFDKGFYWLFHANINKRINAWSCKK